jgi:hypothetical protein
MVKIWSMLCLEGACAGNAEPPKKPILNVGGILPCADDHCTAKYLEQAGVHPALIRLGDMGIHTIMMLKKVMWKLAG